MEAAPERATVAFAADDGATPGARLCEFASGAPEEIRATVAAALDKDAAAADLFAVFTAGAPVGAVGVVRAAAPPAPAAKPVTGVDGGPLVRPEVAKPV